MKHCNRCNCNMENPSGKLWYEFYYKFFTSIKKWTIIRHIYCYYCFSKHFDFDFSKNCCQEISFELRDRFVGIIRIKNGKEDKKIYFHHDCFEKLTGINVKKLLTK